MSELYGHQWKSANGAEPTERWSKAIIHYDVNLVAKFVSNCETGKHHVDFIPSVRDLHIFCKPKNESHKLYNTKQLERIGEPVTIDRIREMQNMTQDELKKLVRERQ